MKALNVPVHVTPVGLVACLPEACDCDNGIIHTYRGTGPWIEMRCPDCVVVGDVLGVVTKCDGCIAKGWLPNADVACPMCDGTGYAPLTFVKVLDVRPIVPYGDWEIGGPHQACVTVDNYGNAVWMSARGTQDEGAFGQRLHLPDAEPGGVALHVEWTDCLTCQTPFVPPSDAPIVEVK